MINAQQFGINEVARPNRQEYCDFRREVQFRIDRVEMKIEQIFLPSSDFGRRLRARRLH